MSDSSPSRESMFETLSVTPSQIGARIIRVAEAWAGNSVNANILRHNSVVSHGSHQYVAFYDADAFVVLAKRELSCTQWETRRTQHQGNINDAHNSISIMVDGDGYLHLSWDHHCHPLRYCRSTAPGALEMTDKQPMTGQKEERVTYPEFYRLSNGDLLFLYRDGSSGNGDLMMNHYDTRTQKWTQRQTAFISGEGQRNAYWQMCTDTKGSIHISWVWRETGDVATNHDMGYARSDDGGKTWVKPNGDAYTLPITASNAEYAARIPQGHELINTTGMCADSDGRPYIATYWRPEGTDVPQYHLIHHDGSAWRVSQIGERKTAFSLSGGGTKRVPMSRPRIVADSSGKNNKAYLLFRDEERRNRVSVATCDDLRKPEWRVDDLTDFSVDMWEPSYDTEAWARARTLHVYVQRVGQGDGETTEAVPPSQVAILEWSPR